MSSPVRKTTAKSKPEPTPPSAAKRCGYAVSSADGSAIYYEVIEPERPATAGAPAVAFCDGIGCDGYVWPYLERALIGGHRIIHWHYRGHGRSPTPRDRGRIAIADHADDLAAVLDDAGAAQAIVAGHSMGVQVALETYRRHRDRVAALVLVCGAPGHPLRTFRGSDLLEQALPGIRKLVDRAPRLVGALTRAVVPTRLSYLAATLLEANGDLLEPADFMVYLRGLSRVEPVLFLDMLEQANRHSARDLLPEIAVPTLIVTGTGDGFTPQPLARAMQSAVPGAELAIVRDGSHTCPIERPRFFNAAVLDFLRRRLAGPR